MANVLSMAIIQSIITLHQSGHSNRRIAQLLGIHRETVNRHVRELKGRLAAAQNRPIAPTGSELVETGLNSASAPGGRYPSPPVEGNPLASRDQKPAALTDSQPAALADPQPAAPTDSHHVVVTDPHHVVLNDPHHVVLTDPWHAALDDRRFASAASIAGKGGRGSRCAALAEVIQEKLGRGLSATRIHQDLCREHGFQGSYYSVRRFIMKRFQQAPLPFRRMEVSPGEEAQIDFGTGAPVITADGKKRRPWMFRIVLSHSRKAYSEVVWRQTTDQFIAAIENAFHYFGGVPKRLVIDNLKAAVHRADWYDPEIHPKLQSFANHYGTAFVPTRPYTPRHKGKVESSVKYAKRNALQGHEFASLAEQNDHLLDWERNVADTRIHGTTKRQVKQQFEEVERPALMALPRDRFANFQEARRTVSRDGHLEVAKAFYSAPPEYVGRRVWVRWDSRMVRVFNDHWESIAVHSRCEPGRFRTDAAHIPWQKFTAIEHGTDALLRQVAQIGPHVRAWSEAMIAARGIEGVRVLVGLKALAHKHPVAALEAACQTALNHRAWRLRSVRQLLKRAADAQQQTMSFLDEHPIIRPLADYSIEALTQFRQERTYER